MTGTGRNERVAKKKDKQAPTISLDLHRSWMHMLFIRRSSTSFGMIPVHGKKVKINGFLYTHINEKSV